MPARSSKLVVSFVGYSTNEVEIDGSEDLNISLETTAADLNKVFVVGMDSKESHINRRCFYCISIIKSDVDGSSVLLND